MTELAGDGVLTMAVWPTFAGAVKSNGDEPMFDADYRRGQITWEVNEHGVITGRAVIDVPAGQWDWIIYCHNPFAPGYITAQKLTHPLIRDDPGVIELSKITEDDVRPLAPDPTLHD